MAASIRRACRGGGRGRSGKRSRQRKAETRSAAIQRSDEQAAILRQEIVNIFPKWAGQKQRDGKVIPPGRPVLDGNSAYQHHGPSLRAKRSNPPRRPSSGEMDRFVASLLAMTMYPGEIRLPWDQVQPTCT